MVLLLFLLLIILVVHSVFCILKTKEKTKTKDEAVICLLFQLTLVINNGKSNSIMFARKYQNQTVSDSSSFFKSKRSLYGLFWHPNVFSFKTHLHSQYIVYKKGLEFGNETVKHWRNHEQTMAYNKSSSFIFKF